MDTATRNALRSTVIECRKLLETSISEHLEGKFGIDAKGKVAERAGMTHLSPEELAFRDQLVSHLEHIRAAGFEAKDAVAQLVREVAFTHLNRLCAYKMLEQRGHIREAVSRGVSSNGFLRYLAEHPDAHELWVSGKQDTAYQHFLSWLGSTLTEEIGVLFSPTDPANRLYPPQRVLDEVIALINGGTLESIWESDETVGWIYQYFTPKELRDKARKESQAPRNSYELAFRNQFYTPRYVVQFLTDNTLGRIWYEMRHGETALAECEYLVRYPDEIFLGDWQGEGDNPLEAFTTGKRQVFPTPNDLTSSVRPFNGTRDARLSKWQELANTYNKEEIVDLSHYKTQYLIDCLYAMARADQSDGRFAALILTEVERRVCTGMDPDTSQEVLLKAPRIVPFRAKKDPRDLRILDPACGSGHFLLYCFDLLERVYLEAWEDPDSSPFSGTGKRLCDEYPDNERLKWAIPGLILRHNLHGIDIDPRATQIASLALWLRAQRAFQDLGIKRGERPAITRSNIVCAESMPGEKDLLEEFVSDLQPPVLGSLVKVVFEKMQLAGEAGSLLKIEEEIRDAIAEAKCLWLTRPKNVQLTLFPTEKRPQWQSTLYDLSGITDESFWEVAEQRVLEALRDYTAQAANGKGYRRKLFADDAEQGFAFIELCRKRYDVVLMNPPFGAASVLSKPYIDEKYPITRQDVYTAFVERGVDILFNAGIIGAITNRTGFFLLSFQKWREEIIMKHAPLLLFADLGHGVLDTAMVETATYVLTKVTENYNEACFFRVIEDAPGNKGEALKEAVNTHREMNCNSIKISSFSQIPSSPFSYWVSNSIRHKFLEIPPFEGNLGIVRKGLDTGDDFQFLRLSWEVSPDKINTVSQNFYGNDNDYIPKILQEQSEKGLKWSLISKGGQYSPFYSDIHLVINWEKNGWGLKNFYDENGKLRSYIRGEDHYFSPGLTWSRRTTSRLSFRILPQGVIFSDVGSIAIISDFSSVYSYLGVFLSNAYYGLIKLSLGADDAAAKQYDVGNIQRMPVPEITKNIAEIIGTETKEAILRKMSLYQHDETSKLFISLPRCVCEQERFSDIFEGWQRVLDNLRFEIDTLQTRIDDLSYNSYNIFKSDREVIEKTVESRPSPIGDIHVNPQDLISSLVSYTLGCVFGRWDIRYATGERQLPALPDPFAPLPACSPGMLQGDDGLPLKEAPPRYPLAIDWDGILVDDEVHGDDIVRRVRDVFQVIWGERAADIEQEACELLGVKSLRDYFRKLGKGGFWDDHVKRYSKSRRKAPIYWLLQSAKRNYALWIYYHRLDADTLFKALERYVKPKVQREENRLQEMQAEKADLGVGGPAAKQLEAAIEKQEAFIGELVDFRDKLQRAADLFLTPDLDDGVVLTITPLYALVPWSEPKKYWEELLEGKYEWSSIGKQLRQKGLVK